MSSPEDEVAKCNAANICQVSSLFSSWNHLRSLPCGFQVATQVTYRDGCPNQHILEPEGSTSWDIASSWTHHGRPETEAWIVYTTIYDWLVVWTPLTNISQLGILFPIYGKIKNVWNHQPDEKCTWWAFPFHQHPQTKTVLVRLDVDGFFYKFVGNVHRCSVEVFAINRCSTNCSSPNFKLMKLTL